MIAVKIRRIGNSLGLVLPKEALSHLRVTEGDTVYLVEGPEESFQLSAYDGSFEDTMQKAEGILERYRQSLRALKA